MTSEPGREGESDTVHVPHAHYLIVDLEATCANDGSLPREETEIIEIGAVMLDARRFELRSEFQSFVRPVRHPVLTPFCTELTSISQEQVDNAEPFPVVLTRLLDWANGFEDWLFCSWGDYDRQQFERDCRRHGVAYPFTGGHVNLKAEFSTARNQRRRFGVGGALHELGLAFDGTPHRGIDDARNIARIVQHVCGKEQGP